jgi:hypothetical protein
MRTQGEGMGGIGYHFVIVDDAICLRTPDHSEGRSRRAQTLKISASTVPPDRRPADAAAEATYQWLLGTLTAAMQGAQN